MHDIVEDEDDFIDFVDIAGDKGPTEIFHLRVVPPPSSDTDMQV